MIKLSELQNDVKVMDENSNVHDVKDVKNDLKHWKDKCRKLYTTTQYQANINAKDMLESAIEDEYQNMYEDWDDKILNDISDEDIEKIQAVLDDILNRNKEQNIAYYLEKEIEVDYE